MKWTIPVGALVALALVACGGGGGGGDPAPAPAPAPAPGPAPAPAPPASDLVTRADILACPEVSSPISSTNWTSCLAGKRLLGRDTFASTQVCELRFQANGGVEYIHNGTSYFPQVNGPARSGVYAYSSFAQLFLGSLAWNYVSTAQGNKLVDMSLKIALANISGPSSLQIDYVDATDTRRVLNCTPNAI